MHPLQLVVHREQLATDVIGMRQTIQHPQHIFQGSLRLDHQTTIRASGFVNHADACNSSIHAMATKLSCMRPYHKRNFQTPLRDWALKGGGKRKLLSQESNTNTEDVQRQACIPELGVPPIRNTAPDSSVPTKRPAALAM